MRKVDELVSGCMAKASSKEMTFVLLSRDVTAPATIRFWVSQRLEQGKNKPDDAQILDALECARVMEREGRPPKEEEK